jgi:hypothetical protein
MPRLGIFWSLVARGYSPERSAEDEEKKRTKRNTTAAKMKMGRKATRSDHVTCFCERAVWISGIDAPQRAKHGIPIYQFCSAMTFCTPSICRFPRVRCPGVSHCEESRHCGGLPALLPRECRQA